MRRLAVVKARQYQRAFVGLESTRHAGELRLDRERHEDLAQRRTGPLVDARRGSRTATARSTRASSRAPTGVAGTRAADARARRRPRSASRAAAAGSAGTARNNRARSLDMRDHRSASPSSALPSAQRPSSASSPWIQPQSSPQLARDRSRPRRPRGARAGLESARGLRHVQETRIHLGSDRRILERRRRARTLASRARPTRRLARASTSGPRLESASAANPALFAASQ